MTTRPSSTVIKAFQVLDLFRTRPTISVSDCADQLDIPKSTAHRLLVSLRESGAVEASSDGRYQLTLRMFELGSAVTGRTQLVEAARPTLQLLAAQEGLPVHLAVRDHLHIVYLEKLHRSFDRLPTRVGQRGLLHSTGLGKVLLAYAPENVAWAVAEGGLVALTGNTIVLADRLRQELEDIRRNGYAYDVEETRPGLVCAAAPIRAPDGSVIAALSISAPSIRYRAQLTLLRSRIVIAAARITVVLRERAAAQSGSSAGSVPLPPEQQS